ncbi:hypothetical protein A0H81_07791 [Grifola frondosa]|uniref:Zonadhesin n=1 Tax=Grifola frondosa TaxID=5627 RepID=A0A1C7M5X0_GRIFR|nr:hypothetical protein A0H81_07791 [Grifola frondosa]
MSLVLEGQEQATPVLQDTTNARHVSEVVLSQQDTGDVLNNESIVDKHTHIEEVTAEAEEFIADAIHSVKDAFRLKTHALAAKYKHDEDLNGHVEDAVSPELEHALSNGMGKITHEPASVALNLDAMDASSLPITHDAAGDIAEFAVSPARPEAVLLDVEAPTAVEVLPEVATELQGNSDASATEAVVAPEATITVDEVHSSMTEPVVEEPHRSIEFLPTTTEDHHPEPCIVTLTTEEALPVDKASILIEGVTAEPPTAPEVQLAVEDISVPQVEETLSETTRQAPVVEEPLAVVSEKAPPHDVEDTSMIVDVTPVVGETFAVVEEEKPVIPEASSVEKVVPSDEISAIEKQVETSVEAPVAEEQCTAAPEASIDAAEISASVPVIEDVTLVTDERAVEEHVPAPAVEAVSSTSVEVSTLEEVAAVVEVEESDAATLETLVVPETTTSVEEVKAVVLEDETFTAAKAPVERASVEDVPVIPETTFSAEEVEAIVPGGETSISEKNPFEESSITSEDTHNVIPAVEEAIAISPESSVVPKTPIDDEESPVFSEVAQAVVHSDEEALVARGETAVAAKTATEEASFVSEEIHSAEPSIVQTEELIVRGDTSAVAKTEDVKELHDVTAFVEEELKEMEALIIRGDTSVSVKTENVNVTSEELPEVVPDMEKLVAPDVEEELIVRPESSVTAKDTIEEASGITTGPVPVVEAVVPEGEASVAAQVGVEQTSEEPDKAISAIEDALVVRAESSVIVKPDADEVEEVPAVVPPLEETFVGGESAKTEVVSITVEEPHTTIEEPPVVTEEVHSTVEEKLPASTEEVPAFAETAPVVEEAAVAIGATTVVAAAIASTAVEELPVKEGSEAPAPEDRPAAVEETSAIEIVIEDVPAPPTNETAVITEESHSEVDVIAGSEQVVATLETTPAAVEEVHAVEATPAVVPEAPVTVGEMSAPVVVEDSSEVVEASIPVEPIQSKSIQAEAIVQAETASLQPDAAISEKPTMRYLLSTQTLRSSKRPPPSFQRQQLQSIVVETITQDAGVSDDAIVVSDESVVVDRTSVPDAQVETQEEVLGETALETDTAAKTTELTNVLTTESEVTGAPSTQETSASIHDSNITKIVEVDDTAAVYTTAPVEEILEHAPLVVATESISEQVADEHVQDAQATVGLTEVANEQTTAIPTEVHASEVVSEISHEGLATHEIGAESKTDAVVASTVVPVPLEESANPPEVEVAVEKSETLVESEAPEVTPAAIASEIVVTDQSIAIPSDEHVEVPALSFDSSPVIEDVAPVTPDVEQVAVSNVVEVVDSAPVSLVPAKETDDQAVAVIESNEVHPATTEFTAVEEVVAEAVTETSPVEQQAEVVSEEREVAVEKQPSILVEEAVPSIEAEVVETTPERPERPWTPSYSVTRQGPGTPEPEVVEEHVEVIEITESHTEPVPEVATPSSAPQESTTEQINGATSNGTDLHAFPSTEEAGDDHTVSAKPSLARLAPVNEDAQIEVDITSTHVDDASLLSPRTRHESTASSRFFPGGWFSSTHKLHHEGRTSLDHATGEFTRSPVEPSSALEAPANTPVDNTDEGKKKWCVVM